MGQGFEPERLAQVVSHLIALKGFARVRGEACLAEAWRAAAGARVADATRVLGIRRGVLQVAVGNAPLLGELASYQKPALLEALSRDHPDLKIRDLKFVMKGDLSAA